MKWEFPCEGALFNTAAEKRFVVVTRDFSEFLGGLV
jgi:hypothetical protein